MMNNKPIKAKPSYYAIMFEPLKEIATKYGYNLVLHGSLNRDMDLIAIPWVEELGDVKIMLNEFCNYVGGELLTWPEYKDGKTIEREYTQMAHGRRAYIIDIYRGGYLNGGGFQEMSYHQDPQTYIDLSIIF